MENRQNGDNMTSMRSIARKRLLFNKTESFFIIFIISVMVGALLVSFSLSKNYFDFFIAEAEALTGNSLSKVLDNSVSNLSEIGEYIVDFTMYFVGYQVPEKIEDFIPPPSANNSDSLFSPTALVENIPLAVFSLSFIILVVTWLSLSIVFSSCKRERRTFYSALMLSGASFKQIKKCAFYEGVYYCFCAIPFGIFFGITGMHFLKHILVLVFEKLAFDYSGLNFAIEVKFSFFCLLLVIPFMFLAVLAFSKKACKKLSVNTAATQARQGGGTDIGLCTFTANPIAYKRKGIEYYVAIRNFQNNFGKYFKIIFMTIMYTAIIGLTFVIFNIIRNYNNQEILLYDTELLSFTYSFQMFFCSVAVVVCVMTLISTFVAIFANINSNMGEYAVMRSVGSSIKSILKTVKIEGFICSISGFVFSVAGVLYSVSFMMEIYRNDSDVYFGGFGTVAGIVCATLSMFVLCVWISVVMINKKMKILDTVKVLKDYFY